MQPLDGRVYSPEEIKLLSSVIVAKAKAAELAYELTPFAIQKKEKAQKARLAKYYKENPGAKRRSNPVWQLKERTKVEERIKNLHVEHLESLQKTIQEYIGMLRT